MITPLDPAIAPDPSVVTVARSRHDDTSEGARCIRALAAACADIAPPQVQNIDEVEVLGAEVRLPARVYRVSREKSPTVVFFHEGGWVAGDLETHDRQARLLAIETGAVVARSAISGTRRIRQTEKSKDVGGYESPRPRFDSRTQVNTRLPRLRQARCRRQAGFQLE